MTVLETICERSVSPGLGFLLAGGHAVIAHGYARTTFDLDLIIRRTDRDGWLALLTSLGFSAHHEGPTFLQLNPSPSERWPVDLMFVNDLTFQKMMTDAMVMPVGKASANVVSLRHLIALKCHAIRHGHSGRVVKDTDDLIRIIEANSVNVNEPEIRGLILKHATHELYEKSNKSPAHENDAPSVEAAASDLDFPDWSGMRKRLERISLEDGFRLSEEYMLWLPRQTEETRLRPQHRITVEFVL